MARLVVFFSSVILFAFVTCPSPEEDEKIDILAKFSKVIVRHYATNIVHVYKQGGIYTIKRPLWVKKMAPRLSWYTIRARKSANEKFRTLADLCGKEVELLLLTEKIVKMIFKEQYEYTLHFAASHQAMSFCDVLYHTAIKRGPTVEYKLDVVLKEKNGSDSDDDTDSGSDSDSYSDSDSDESEQLITSTPVQEILVVDGSGDDDEQPAPLAQEEVDVSDEDIVVKPATLVQKQVSDKLVIYYIKANDRQIHLIFSSKHFSVSRSAGLLSMSVTPMAVRGRCLDYSYELTFRTRDGMDSFIALASHHGFLDANRPEDEPQDTGLPDGLDPSEDRHMYDREELAYFHLMESRLNWDIED